MNLYLLSQIVKTGYDTFDSCIVASESEADARTIHPSGGAEYNLPRPNRTWANKPEDVGVELIGTAVPGTERGVILASFIGG